MERIFGEIFFEEGEEEALKKLYEEAVSKYEEALGVPPPKDWTIEQIVKDTDKKIAQQDKVISEIHRPSGLESRRMQRGDWNRGHRKGIKPKKPKGGETISKKAAA